MCLLSLLYVGLFEEKKKKQYPLAFYGNVFSANDSLVCDGVDFDEPMEVGHEEDMSAVTEDAEPEPKVAAAVKVEPKAEPQDPVLL